MSLLVAKGIIVAALPMKGWYVCICMHTLYNTLPPLHSTSFNAHPYVFVYISKWAR